MARWIKPGSTESEIAPPEPASLEASELPTLPEVDVGVGLANALVWPSIWPLALDGLGKFTPQGSALLIMGVAGGALIPLLFGRISLIIGDMQLAYWICFPCYLYILFYAAKGHKIRKWK